MKPNRRLSLIVTVASVLFFAWFLLTNTDQLRVLKNLKPAPVILLFCLSFLPYILNTVMQKIFFSHYGYAIRYRDSLLLCSVAAYWNYLPVRVGSLVRALYLKTRFQVPFHLYAVYMVIPQITLYCLIGAIGLVFCGVLAAGGASFPWSIAAFFVVLSGASYAIARTNPERLLKKTPDIESLQKAVECWSAAWKSKRLIMAIASIKLASVVIQISRYAALFYILFGDSRLLYSAFFGLFDTASGVIAITPGGLGIKEGCVAISSYLLEFPVENAVFVALVNRAFNMAIVFSMGLAASLALNKSLLPPKTTANSSANDKNSL